MFVAYIVVAVLLGLGLAASGSQKIQKNERIVAGLTRAGVPLSWFVPLALLDIAGTIGLLIGIWWRPLGIAAAIGIIVYFIGALIAHMRAKDTKGMPIPATLLVVAVLALALGLASA
jgi:uncharacterized membrane protein YphA (DoxX/SURF4 family)